MTLENTQLIQILNSMNVKSYQNSNSEFNFRKQGREQEFDETQILKVFILMQLTNIRTIKGIWKFLKDNQEITTACGFSKLPDRSTLSRRLNKLNIKNWL
jgi:hypothetical protein